MDANRFDRARIMPAYKAAFLDDVPEPQINPVGVVAGLAIIAALVAVLAVVKLFAALVMAATAIVAISALIASMIAERRAPVMRQLAIVSSTWTGIRGSSAEIQRVARSVRLRDAFGLERDFRMSPRVVGDALDGAIGVATIRRGTVIQFAALDA